MKDRLTPRFKQAMTRTRFRVAAGSAAALAAALTTGLLVTQTGTPSTGHDAAAVSVADLAHSNDQALRLDGGAGAGAAAPATSAPEPATSTPAAKAAPAKPAAAKAPAKPAPPASKVLDYDYQAQINGWYCGPGATRIALSARGKAQSQDAIAAALGTTMNGTNSAEDTTRVLNDVLGGNFYSTTAIPNDGATPAQMDQLQADVVHAVSNGYAVVANIVGSATDTDGGWHSYDGGHYLTVVGYRDNGRTVQIADPAYVNGVSSYWMTTIDLANWIGTRGYSA
ncbi:C39 family peptidase [Micromonospora sp. NPDC049559]|uniref:C39 family peptidase n=1 Tax=Micromonospora sp. NPDC049559 TaxID=3155923 RepID=UPI0034207CE7